MITGCAEDAGQWRMSRVGRTEVPNSGLDGGAGSAAADHRLGDVEALVVLG